MTTRNQVRDALFALLQGAADWKTTALRADWPSQTTAQPAMYLRVLGEEHSPRMVRTAPAIVAIDYEVWIFDNTNANGTDAESTILDNLADAVEDALRPDPGREAQTLGGLVQWCRIEGKLMYDPGDITGQGVAVIPIKVLAPGL